MKEPIIEEDTDENIIITKHKDIYLFLLYQLFSDFPRK